MDTLEKKSHSFSRGAGKQLYKRLNASFKYSNYWPEEELQWHYM